MLKKDFPIFQNNPGLIYLDSASTAQKPQCVIEGVSSYLSNDYANIHRGGYDLSERSELLYWKTRQLVASFIGGQDEEIIFTANATDSINKLVKTLVFSGAICKGDVVLLSELEHHANIIPWQIIAKEYGIEIEYIGLDADHQIDAISLKEKLHERVKVISCTLVSNVTGGITDIRLLMDTIHSSGCSPLVILDISQAVPHISIDVSQLGIDFCYFTGHKLGAHTGIGVLRGKKEHLNSLSPAYGGGGMVDEVTKNGFTMLGTPDKFEAGTPNVVGAVSLSYALTYIKTLGHDHTFASGYAMLETIEKPLIVYCLEQFTKLEMQGISLLGPTDPEKRIGVFSFLLPEGKHATQLGQYMAKKNICMRGGAQCAHIFHAGLAQPSGISSGMRHTCRISLRGYTDIEDVAVFFQALKLFIS